MRIHVEYDDFGEYFEYGDTLEVAWEYMLTEPAAEMKTSGDPAAGRKE